MDDDHELILVASYPNLDDARTDFGELEKRIEHGLELRAAALITKNDEGHPEVIEARNRHGRAGAGWGAGVGFLLGLFVPPMVLSVFVGAAAGAVVASFADHEVRVGLRREVGQALEVGTGVLVVLVYPNGRVPVESTLLHAAEIRSLRMDRTTIDSLDQTVAEEVKKLHATAAPTSDTKDTNT